MIEAMSFARQAGEVSKSKGAWELVRWGEQDGLKFAELNVDAENAIKVAKCYLDRSLSGYCLELFVKYGLKQHQN